MFSNIRCREGKLNEAVERMENCQSGEMVFSKQVEKGCNTHLESLDRSQTVH